MQQILCRADRLGVLLALDHYGIYDSDIWILYKYICDCSIPDMCDVVHALCCPSSRTKDRIADIRAGRAVGAAPCAAPTARQFAPRPPEQRAGRPLQPGETRIRVPTRKDAY
jgi:hypothetical protein